MVLNNMSEEYLSQLIGRYASGTATREEVNELLNWYHAATINDVQWPVAGPGEKEEVYQRMIVRLKKETTPGPAKIIRFPWVKIAAMLLIIAGAGLAIAYFSKPETPSYITISNPVGAIQKIRLPDSSYVWLNASTSLRYKKSFQENRELELDGEAFFEVTHDASHPFKIKADGVETTVLGTAFDIKAYASEKTTSVCVVNGRVQVADDQMPATILKASDVLIYDKQLHTVSLSSVDSAIKPAWTEGKFEFKGERFDLIAETLERWYGVHFIFSTPDMRDCRYYASFDNISSLQNILTTMSGLNGMQYVIEKDTVTISGKGCN